MLVDKRKPSFSIRLPRTSNTQSIFWRLIQLVQMLVLLTICSPRLLDKQGPAARSLLRGLQVPTPNPMFLSKQQAVVLMLSITTLHHKLTLASPRTLRTTLEAQPPTSVVKQ